jgi:hypothetical protein
MKAIKSLNDLAEVTKGTKIFLHSHTGKIAEGFFVEARRDGGKYNEGQISILVDDNDFPMLKKYDLSDGETVSSCEIVTIHQMPYLQMLRYAYLLGKWEKMEARVA